MLRVMAAVLCFAAILVPARLFATPPTSAEIRAKVEEFYKVYEGFPERPTPEQMEALKAKSAALASKLMEGIDVKELDAANRSELMPLIMSSPVHLEQVQAIIEHEAAGPGAGGFAAACQLIEFTTGDAAQRASRVIAAIDHPGALEGLAKGDGSSLWWAVQETDKSQLASKTGRLAELSKAYGPGASDQAMRSAAGCVRCLRDVLPNEQFQKIRVTIAAEVGDRAAKATGEQQKRWARAAAELNGAAMRGELLGHVAPPMTFQKVYAAEGQKAWTSLADLKGKVVVIDFWATWCGPCVGSFPNVRDMRAAYSPNDVEIVGVTSIQGFVASRKNGKIDCKGDPAKELSALADFMKELDMTWTVAVSDQDVFNPDFGVQGIPFVAILDKEGKVVNAGLHAANHEAITKIVDELLGKAPAAKTAEGQPAKQ